MRKFAEASSTRSVNISSLEKKKPYSIIRAERLQTKYGISVLLTIWTSSTDTVRVFLPRRFTLVFSDLYIDMINDGMIKINLFFIARSKRLVSVCSRYNWFDNIISNYKKG